MTDGLSTLYQDLLGGSYDCVDRIVLNAYFRMGHDPGGFRVWWRALTGSDETLENAYLMRLAGRFSRRLRGYAKAHDIPVIDCPAGQRKCEYAWNKDPVFGVIGIQSGPRRRRVHSGFHGGHGSRFGDADSGDDRKDPPRVSGVAEGRAQGDPVAGDRVSLRARPAAIAAD